MPFLKIARAIACGMNDFLAKPVARAVLAAMLAKWVKTVRREGPGPQGETGAAGEAA